MKIKILISTLLTSVSIYAQVPTGSPPTPYPAFTVPEVRNVANSAWYRGGNTPGGPAGAANIFGTMWNSPIFHQTNGITRMQMNGTVSNVINGGANLPKNGFIGIGNPIGFYNGSGAGQGPFSLLHLNGINPLGQPQTGGYRDWMQYGITSTHNQDLAFFGQRKNGAGSDITDVVIGWADNSAAGAGPDNMVFNFLAGPQGGSNDLNGDALNGREIMRLTAIGNVGIGPRFNNAWQPQSTLHQHQENSAESWMQITNQASPIFNNPTTIVNGPTAITANDGLRWGIDPTNIGYIYNQENKHLLFSTNHNAGTSEERMRITHIGAPTTPNPGNTFANDLTRVSISHDPLNPINRPLALLHLGYNTGNTIIPGQAAGTDGWRNWMEVGTLVSRSTDHVFMGLKPNANGLINGFNRQDAVIAWGDDYNSALPIVNTGPDKLRIIFTSPTTSQPFAGPGAMSTQDGLEFVRYVPFHNTNLNINDPRTGFGDFQNLTPVGTINPGNTIEINSIMNGFNAAANTNVTGSYAGSTGASGLRFRDLTSQSTIVPSTETAVDHTKVLSVDSLGNVVLIEGGGCKTTLVLTSPSSSCPTGGVTVQYGVDANCNGVLDPSEINNTLTQNICNGAVGNTGAAGAAGTNGLNTLANSTTVGNGFGGCATGGIKIETGVDLNNDNILQANEITQTQYVCNGLPGPTGPAGGIVNAQNGLSLLNPSTVEFGNAVGGTSATLLNDREIPMANHNIVYTGDGKTGFGTNAPAAKLHVVSTSVPAIDPLQVDINVPGQGTTIPAFLVGKSNTISCGLFPASPLHNFSAKNSDASQPYRFRLFNNNFSSVFSVDVYGSATANPNLVEISTGDGKNLEVNLGNAAAQNATFRVRNASNHTAIKVVNGSMNVGIKNNNPLVALDVVGDIFASGMVTWSDSTLKTNIQSLSNSFCSQKIKALRPISYEWITKKDTAMYGTKYGFTAQQVETVLPDLVLTGTDGIKRLDYIGIIPLLVKAVQEQQSKIDSLKHAIDSLTTKVNTKDSIQDARLAALEAAIDKCCTNANAKISNNSTQTAINQLDIELSDKDAIVLNQNVPNPFAEQTTITYNVPESVAKAQIIFYNSAGQIIQTVDVKTRGKGKVNVFASDLSSGLYHYTLVADGKVVDSKKMVRE